MEGISFWVTRLISSNPKDILLCPNEHKENKNIDFNHISVSEVNRKGYLWRPNSCTNPHQVAFSLCPLIPHYSLSCLLFTVILR